MSNRRSGGMVNRGNRYFDNHGGGGGGGGGGGRVAQNNGRGNSMGNMNYAGHGQQGGWRQGASQNRQNNNSQGGNGMNAFDSRQFQQQQMMNQNQFQNQLSNAVLRNSVGPNPGMMSSFGGNQDQPVVMVLPQSQATGGMMGGNMNNMGMVQSQNPFAAAVMNQQKPMQVIVGNLPAGLNPAAFGQQVLPAYGQGVGEQNMGMFGQQTQQGSNRFGRDNKMSSDRGRIQRNQKVALVRRNDANDRGRVTTPRGVAKKRGLVVREQYSDNKKPKTVTGGPPRNNNNRVALPVRKGMKTRRAKPVGNKTATKPDGKGKETAKTDAATANGKPATEGEVKPATEAVAEPAVPEEKKPSKYEGMPVELLVCKVCKKTSSDATAFEAHLTSKLHVNLMKILEEKFTKRAELLMYESKMCEDEIAVEMDRPRRAGKGPHGGKGNKHHCKMCDCNYTVNWGTHKQSVWHRTLKEFLHPNCRFCKSQFVHRRDWIEHIISVSHMKKLIELREEGQLSSSDLQSTSQEELFAVHIEVNREEKPLNIVNFHSLGGRYPITDDIKDMLAGEKGEIVLPEGDIKIPEQYDENVAVGEDTVVLVGGSCCKVCRMYIHEKEEGHCKSRLHFDTYVEYLRRIVKLREQKAEDERKAKEEAEQKAKAEAEAAAKAAEEATKAAEAALKVEASAESTESKETTDVAAATKQEQMEVEQTADNTVASSGQKPEELVVLEEADGNEAEQGVEKMEEDQPAAEAVPAKTPEPAKPAPSTPSTTVTPSTTTTTPVTPSTPKTPQRGGQNNSRGGRGSPARGRGGPNRGGGGYGRGGRGGQQQQQQTPSRNATPRVDSNMRGGRGGQRGGGGRGGARGSPGRGRGRGGW